MNENVRQRLNLAGDAVQSDNNGTVRLVGSKCSACGKITFPPTEVCPECMSEEILPFKLSSHGTLYSWSIVHAAPKGWDLPFIAAYVDLSEEVRVFAHIVDADPSALQMDMAVEACVASLGKDEAGEPFESYAFTPVKLGGS